MFITCSKFLPEMDYEGKLIGKSLEETMQSIGNKKGIRPFAKAYIAMSRVNAVSFLHMLSYLTEK